VLASTAVAWFAERVGDPDPVTAAFRAVPRAPFLPEKARGRAGYDGPIDIGHGQTNSQPRTVADMLRLLDARPGQRILDVGAGSGWTTALLAHLVGPTGRVYGVERVPELVDLGNANLEAVGVQARVEQADPDVPGLPAYAPFDRILVSAEALSLPDPLVTQLADGGRMVIPVRGTMLLVERAGDDVGTSRHGSYRFVPLL
jgi:protein-L-isoaspartate(D-aspartate) O-methyltransferase